MECKYQIGDWVEVAEGVAQVIFLRELYVEKLSAEYFEGEN